jgi:thymidylate synthase ThyX
MSNLVQTITSRRSPTYAHVLEASATPIGEHLTTLEVFMPRIILAEFNTHRVFSRNVSSSRAIPVLTMLRNLKKNAFTPSYWGKNQKGMQAKHELTGFALVQAKFWWAFAIQINTFITKRLHGTGLHKQLANRWIEPAVYVKAVVSATEFGNFLELRVHEDAQPEIIDLAAKVKEALECASHRVLSADRTTHLGWHLPYITQFERETVPLAQLLCSSVARCARTSYMPQGGGPVNYVKERQTYVDLVGAVPRHSSPAEHPACLALTNLGNFQGFTQLRHMIEAGEIA